MSNITHSQARLHANQDVCNVSIHRIFHVLHDNIVYAELLGLDAESEKEEKLNSTCSALTLWEKVIHESGLCTVVRGQKLCDSTQNCSFSIVSMGSC